MFYPSCAHFLLAASLGENRMVERGRCAGDARNARRERAPVRASRSGLIHRHRPCLSEVDIGVSPDVPSGDWLRGSRGRPKAGRQVAAAAFHLCPSASLSYPHVSARKTWPPGQLHPRKVDSCGRMAATNARPGPSAEPDRLHPCPARRELRPWIPRVTIRAFPDALERFARAL